MLPVHGTQTDSTYQTLIPLKNSYADIRFMEGKSSDI